MLYRNESVPGIGETFEAEKTYVFDCNGIIKDLIAGEIITIDIEQTIDEGWRDNGCGALYKEQHKVLPGMRLQLLRQGTAMTTAKWKRLA